MGGERRINMHQIETIRAFSPTDELFPETDPRHPKNRRAPPPQFVAEEVWAIAHAVLDDAVREQDCGRGGAYNTCQHCDERVWWQTSADMIVHKPTCLVLIARGILTGAPTQ